MSWQLCLLVCAYNLPHAVHTESRCRENKEWRTRTKLKTWSEKQDIALACGRGWGSLSRHTVTDRLIGERIVLSAETLFKQIRLVLMTRQKVGNIYLVTCIQELSHRNTTEREDSWGFDHEGLYSKAAQVRVVRCDMRLFDKLSRPLLLCNMFKSSDIGACMRRTGLDFIFKPHTIETTSPIFLQDSSPSRRHGWRHSPATSRSLGFWPPVRRLTTVVVVGGRPIDTYFLPVCNAVLVASIPGLRSTVKEL